MDDDGDLPPIPRQCATQRHSRPPLRGERIAEVLMEHLFRTLNVEWVVEMLASACAGVESTRSLASNCDHRQDFVGQQNLDKLASLPRADRDFVGCHLNASAQYACNATEKRPAD